MTKSAAYTNRILRESESRDKAGQKRPQSVLQALRRENEDLREQLAQARRKSDLLEMENAMARRELMDWQQMTARKNGECR